MTASGAERRISKYEELRAALPGRLPEYLARQRWFGGKARQIHSIELIELIPLQTGQLDAFVLLISVEYQIGSPETYVLPMIAAIASAGEPEAHEIRLPVTRGAFTENVVLSDALHDEGFLLWLLDAIEVKLVSQGVKGEIRAWYSDVFQDVRSRSTAALHPKLLKGEQSNSSVIYGESLILKLFRRLADGVNPDLEIGLFLTEKAHFPHVPPLAGAVEYRNGEGTLATLGILQGFVPNQGDAWRYTLRSIDSFWVEVAKHGAAQPPAAKFASILDCEGEVDPLASSWIGPYLEMVDLLGKRTAELHLALSSDSSDPAFSPEPYTPSVRRDFERSARELTAMNLALLREKQSSLPETARARAEEVLRQKDATLSRFHSAAAAEDWGMRIRIHGDFHLGQVLYTGSDFAMIDFEGEPARPLAERRSKRSPLQDVAGMVRSFHYAAFAHLLAPADGAETPATDRHESALWAERWFSWVASRFLNSYFANASAGAFLPRNRADTFALLRALLLEKAVYELGYELNNRPAWAGIPLAGILELLAG